MKLNYIARFSLLLFILVSGVEYCSAQSKPVPGVGGGTGSGGAEHSLNGWKEFTSEEGRFSVSLPGVPKEIVREIESPFGKAQGHYFNLSTFADFGFSYTNLPVDIENPETAKKLLDHTRDSMLVRFKGKLLEEKDIILDGHPGRFFKIELASGDIARHKVFIVGSRTYQVVFISKGRGVPSTILGFHESAATKFLNSCKLR